MAGRKQKFSVIHMLLMAAALIWLPTLIEQMAGIPQNSVEAEKHSQNEGSASLPVDVKSASETQSSDSQSSASPTTNSPLMKPAPAVVKLQETLLSGSGKTAIINGRAFGEQEMLTPLGYPFRVRTILAGRVILEGDGSLYELRRQRIW